MADVPSVGDTRRYLTLITLFSAARHDATPEQVARLRDEALPMLRDVSNPLSWVVERVFEVMGPEWNPIETGGGHGEWLTRLLAERKAAQ